jgi:hypothetical protein
VTVRGPGQVTRRIYNGLVGGEIVTVHRYYDGREDWYRLFLGLIPFCRLVAPPLQLGVVGPYLVWRAWFPNHLPLVGTTRIKIFGP